MSFWSWIYLIGAVPSWLIAAFVIADDVSSYHDPGLPDYCFAVIPAVVVTFFWPLLFAIAVLGLALTGIAALANRIAA